MCIRDRDDGLWLVDISDGKSSLTGKRIRHRKSNFLTKKEAEEYEAYYRIHKLNQIQNTQKLTISSLYVMLKEEDSIASIVLEKLGLDIEDLMIDIEEIFNFFEGTSEKEDLEITPYPFLTNLSKTKKVHPFIKRSNYIEKIIYILSKKQKNNPLLIGNAGVGKTAIIEGLSEILKNETIYQLDLGSIVSGTKYRGELEEKITKAMEYIKKHHAIVFIDEIHNIVGAGSNDGSLDIANILKPYLSRSDIKLIGSTTLDEYYRFIEKDKALTRRFQNLSLIHI